MTGKIDKFNFSFRMVSEVKSNIESQISNIDSRINKIVDHFTIGDIPVLKLVLNMNPEKQELKKLSKAIDRLSELVDLQNSLNSKLAVVNAAESDPDWFALSFGDFESEVDQTLKQILDQ